MKEILIHDKDFGAKFERSAEEIIESGKFNGCSDNTTVFEYLARKQGIPTVHLLTANIEWIDELNHNKSRKYRGHHFVECYISGKWILVDSTAEKIYEEYDKNNFVISSGRNNYYVYAKCDNVFEINDFLSSRNEPEFVNEINMQRKHNALMKKLFTGFDLSKLDPSILKSNRSI